MRSLPVLTALGLAAVILTYRAAVNANPQYCGFRDPISACPGCAPQNPSCFCATSGPNKGACVDQNGAVFFANVQCNQGYWTAVEHPEGSQLAADDEPTWCEKARLCGRETPTADCDASTNPCKCGPWTTVNDYEVRLIGECEG